MNTLINQTFNDLLMAARLEVKNANSSYIHWRDIADSEKLAECRTRYSKACLLVARLKKLEKELLSNAATKAPY